MSHDASQKCLIDFLTRVEKLPESLTPELNLYADGIGLDSLDVAELDAVFEDELGSSPFAADEMPQTVGDIFSFYDLSAASS